MPSPFPGANFRTNSFSMADIDSNSNIFAVWANENASGHAVAKVSRSTDSGATWTTKTAADIPGRSVFYPAVATKVTVHGTTNVFLGFNAIRDVAAGTRPGAGVVSYDAFFVLSTNTGLDFTDPVKIGAASSDPDAASTNGLGAQFLGDCNVAAAGSDGRFLFSWTDTRTGSTCPAIDAWRASGFTTTKPNIYDACPKNFGHSAIFVGVITPWLGQGRKRCVLVLLRPRISRQIRA